MPSEDFCSIVLAGGSGSKMYPITESFPKCLLNVGNYPLVYYTLRALEDSGFSETILIVRETWLSQIRETLNSIDLKIKIEYYPISEMAEPNTASVIISIRDKLKCNNILILSGDVYGNIALKSMASTYRKRQATFCAYIQPPHKDDIPSTLVNGNNSHRISKQSSTTSYASYTSAISGDFIAFNQPDERLLMCVNEGDVEESLTFQRALLVEYPNFKVYKNHHDLHIYIVKKHLLDFIAMKALLLNFKSDVVPFLLDKQFSIKNTPMTEPQKLIDEISDEDTYDSSKHEFEINNRPIRCYSYVAIPDRKAFRVNTISSFFAANKLALKDLPNSSTSLAGGTSSKKPVNMMETKDYMIGVQSDVSASTNIRRSIIGRSCHIDSQCNIFNSIILNNVTISKRCDISNSIIGNGVTIGESCKISECLVGTTEIIPSNTKCNKETLFGAREMSVID